METFNGHTPQFHQKVLPSAQCPSTEPGKYSFTAIWDASFSVHDFKVPLPAPHGHSPPPSQQFLGPFHCFSQNHLDSMHINILETLPWYLDKGLLRTHQTLYIYDLPVRKGGLRSDAIFMLQKKMMGLHDMMASVRHYHHQQPWQAYFTDSFIHSFILCLGI